MLKNKDQFKGEKMIEGKQKKNNQDTTLFG